MPRFSVRLSRQEPVPARIVLIVLLALLAVGPVACTSDDRSGRPPSPAAAATSALPGWARGASGWIPAEEPAAMAVGPDGSLYLGERRSGRILRVAADQLRKRPPGPTAAAGTAATAAAPAVRAATEVATVVVATAGQQGLLGLAVEDDGALLVGATVPGPPPHQSLLRIRSGGGRPEVVWSGVPAVQQAIGGRIAIGADGGVVMGLGSFERDPATPPYGSLLRLDPTGPADQAPVVLSSGWNNPFAFTVGADGVLWVADNSPGAVPERFGRGDGSVRPVDLAGIRAPSGLAEVGPGRFLLCGYVSERLQELRVAPDGGTQVGTAVGGCRLGVVALPGGDLAVAGPGGVAIRPAP